MTKEAYVKLCFHFQLSTGAGTRGEFDKRRSALGRGNRDQTRDGAVGADAVAISEPETLTKQLLERAALGRQGCRNALPRGARPCGSAVPVGPFQQSALNHHLSASVCSSLRGSTPRTHDMFLDFS